MAHRRKRRTHSRRRRVSGIGGGSVQMILGGVGGYLIGNFANKQVNTGTTVDPNKQKIVAAALIALPILLQKKIKGPLMTGAGIGLAIAGAKAAGTAFNIPMLSGLPVVAGYRKRVNGYGYPVVAGSADQPYLRTGATRQAVVSGVNAAKQVYAGGMMDNYNDK